MQNLFQKATDPFVNFFQKRKEEAKDNIQKIAKFKQEHIVDPINEINKRWLNDMAKKKKEEEDRKKKLEETERKKREFQQKYFVQPVPTPTPIPKATITSPEINTDKGGLFQKPALQPILQTMEPVQKKVQGVFGKLIKPYEAISKAITMPETPKAPTKEDMGIFAPLFEAQRQKMELGRGIANLPAQQIQQHSELAAKIEQGKTLNFWDVLNLTDYLDVTAGVGGIIKGTTKFIGKKLFKTAIKEITEEEAQTLAENATKKATQEILEKTGKQVPKEAVEESTKVAKEEIIKASKEGFEFVSPNIEENLTFDMAEKRLNSPRQITIKKISEDINKQLGLDSEISDAVGDWADGAENTLFIHDKKVPDYETLRYGAALKGKAADQKSVIPFMVDENGKDMLYMMDTPTANTTKLRQLLDASDLKYKTVVGSGDTTKFVIFDKDATLVDTIEKWATKNEQPYGHYKGTGEFLGSWESRAEGRKIYNEVIQTHEALGGRPYSPTQGGGLRDISPEQLLPAEKVAGKSIAEDIQQGFKAAREVKPSKPSVGTNLRTALIDKLSPVFDLVQKAGKELPAETNPYKKMRLYAGVSGRISSVLEDGLAPVLRKESKRLDDLSTMLVLDRNQEIIDRGLRSRYTTEQVQTALNEMRNRLGDSGFNSLMESAQQVRNFADNLLTQLKDAGIITEEGFKAIKDKNQFYVPFEILEHMADSMEKGKYARSSFNTATQDIIKTLKGSEYQVADPLESLVRKATKTIPLIERNKAMQSLVDLRKVNPEVFEKLITPIRTAEDVIEKTKLFGKVREMIPVRNKALRLLKTRGRWIRKIEVELNQLNKLGLKSYLKRPEAEVGEVSVEALAKYKDYLKKSPREARRVIESLIAESPEKLAAIKRKIGFKNKELGKTIDEAMRLQGDYTEAKEQIMELISRANELKTAKESGTEVISLFNKGIVEQYRVPTEVAMAIKNLDQEPLSLLIKMGRVQAQILRGGSTAFNVAFIPVNIIRDMQNAIFGEYAEGGAKAVAQLIYHYPHALGTSFIKGKTYKNWLKAGGSQTTITEALFKHTPENVRALAGQKSIIKEVIKSPKTLIEFVNRVGEQSTRIARFEAGVARGESLVEAAYKSRDITVDFAKSGNTIKLINQVVPFLNANIQGIEKMVRAWRRNPVRATVGAGIMAGTPATLIYLHNRKFKDYQDIPQYEKNQNWVIIARDRTDEERLRGDKIVGIKVPKGQLLQPIANITENFLQYADKNNPQAVSELAMSTLENLSPIGIPNPWNPKQMGRSLSTISLPWAEAGIQMATGTNLYTGMPIVPRKQEGIEKQYQFNEQTPEAAKTIAKYTNQSPLMIESLATTMGGAVGRQALKIASGDVKGATADEIVRRFTPIAEGAQEEAQYQEVAKYQEEGKTESYLRGQEAERLWEEVKNLSRNDYIKWARTLIKTDPKLYARVRTVRSDDLKGINRYDRSIKALTVESRVKYITDKLAEINNKDANRAYILDLRKKGIVSNDVLAKLKKMRKDGLIDF